MPTRRTFLTLAGASLLTHAARPQLHLQTTHLPLAEIDHDRIMAAAAHALTRPIQPNGDPASPAFLDLTGDIPALAAAHLIAPDPKYLAAARPHLRAWFTAPTSRVPTTLPNPEAVTLTAPLAELAIALPFLQLPADDLAPVQAWFTAYLTTLTESRTGGLARDTKAHLGAAWLLQAAAFARLTAAEQVTIDLRHRFKTSTLRAQIDATGAFPHELPTPDPFRNSLFCLDLLAGACLLLSTRFESLWDFELQDGPGMRTAIAHHAPYIAHPVTWPYPADSAHFHELPCRRPSLLFAARAYNQPDYSNLWRSLTPAEPTTPDVLRTFPIRQPILWQTPVPRRPA